MASDIKILIVEDELVSAEVVRDILTGRGYEVMGFVSSAEEALKTIAATPPDLILMDVMIKGSMDGIELADVIYRNHGIPSIYLTAFADGKTVERAKKTESYGYVIKPFTEIELLTAIEIGLNKFSTDSKIRRSEERFRTLFETMKDAVYIRTASGKFIDCNQAMVDLLGYSRDELMIKKVGYLYADPGQRSVMQRKLERSGFVRDYELELRRKDGSVLSVLITATMERAPEGHGRIIHSIIRDITERRKYIDDLTIAHAENVNLINSIESILIGVSIKDVITHWNRMAEVTFGIPSEAAIGKQIIRLGVNWDWNEIYVGIASSISDNASVQLNDIRYTDKAGREGLLGISINPIRDKNSEIMGFIIYGRDITERRQMEQQLQQSGKLATIGEIATGIAHELNQPLNVIKMAAQYMKDSLVEKYFSEEFMHERLDKIIAQVDRADRIITHLREFGRKSDIDLRPIDPNLPIKMAFDLLGEQLRLRSIGVDMRLDPTLPAVNADSQKLEQVFINLIVNARDALEENAVSEREKEIRIESKRDGQSVRIEFSDNGPGISAQIADKIFDPFFTTKEVGKGTGLGLSISYGIIKSHQGSIAIRRGGPGATFIISLPVSDKSLDEIKPSV